MKKKIIPLLFFAGLNFYSQILNAQATISHSTNSITISDLFASGCAVNLPSCNYKLTVNYLSGPNITTDTSTGNTAVVSSAVVNGKTNLFIHGDDYLQIFLQLARVLMQFSIPLQDKSQCFVKQIDGRFVFSVG
jgi:hypothetical protein